jgi:hypothetical protein
MTIHGLLATRRVKVVRLVFFQHERGDRGRELGTRVACVVEGVKGGLDYMEVYRCAGCRAARHGGAAQPSRLHARPNGRL